MEQNFVLETTEDNETFFLKQTKMGQGTVTFNIPKSILDNNNVADTDIAIYEDLVNKTTSV